MSDQAKCELCGEPMPPGETMFKFHGYSGPCPKPPLPRPTPSAVGMNDHQLIAEVGRLRAEVAALRASLLEAHRSACSKDNCILDGGPEHDRAFGA